MIESIVTESNWGKMEENEGQRTLWCGARAAVRPTMDDPLP